MRCGLTRAQALVAMRDDAAFREALAGVLRAAPFEAFCWEMPATSAAHQDRAFEFVMVDSPALAHARADGTEFAAKLAAAKGADVTAFLNLGGDATLVVPTERGDRAAYAHLASFVRRAPRAQVDAFFQTLARTIEARLSSAPLWVSTAGLGVSWLHVRLDARPKYYRHGAYRTG